MHETDCYEAMHVRSLLSQYHGRVGELNSGLSNPRLSLTCPSLLHHIDLFALAAHHVLGRHFREKMPLG